LRLDKIKILAAADLAFSEKFIYAVVAAYSFPDLELIEAVSAKSRLSFPYVPGLLTFREGPTLIKAFKKLKSGPDVIIFDGQGIAHPKRMGVAAHMGVLAGKPSIGCAKSRLIGTHKAPPIKKGSFTLLYDGGEVIGAVVRSRDNVKPLYISRGFKIDLESSIKIVLSCCRGYRIPDPIRYVDAESKKLARAGQ